MMTLNEQDYFKLLQKSLDSQFHGLELWVKNNGPHKIYVECEGDEIIIRVQKNMVLN